GSWYAPERSGEGIVLQVLDDGSAVMFWFTYPPEGAGGDQAWLVAQDGVIDGDGIHFAEVYHPVGTRFGEDFDTGEVQRLAWGSVSLRFLDCGRAELDYDGPDGWGSGSRPLVRLTALDQLDCEGSSLALLPTGARSADG